MATSGQVETLRRFINEPDDVEPYSNTQLGYRIDAAQGDIELTAATIWREKASSYAELVDVQEGSSRRALGNLQSQAMKMADYYQGVSSSPPESSQRRTRTRPIERQ